MLGWLKQLKFLSSLLATGSILVLPDAALATEHSVIQKDKKFSVPTITINQGDSIVFTNQEKDITHNVFSIGPKNEFELKTQKPGSSNTVVFKDPGPTEVECAIHPSMKMIVQVEPSSGPAPKKKN